MISCSPVKPRDRSASAIRRMVWLAWQSAQACPILAGLVEERVDLAPEGRKAQEPGTAERGHRKSRRRVRFLRRRSRLAPSLQRRVGRERLDPAGQRQRTLLSARAGNQPVLLDDRQRARANLGVGIDQESLEVLLCVGTAPEGGPGSGERQPEPAQGRRVIGQAPRRAARRRPVPTRAPAGRRCRGASARAPRPKGRRVALRSNCITVSRRLATIQKSRAVRPVLRSPRGAVVESVAARPARGGDRTSASRTAGQCSTGSRLGAASVRAISLRMAAMSSGRAASRSFRPIARRMASRSAALAFQNRLEQRDAAPGRPRPRLVPATRPPSSRRRPDLGVGVARGFGAGPSGSMFRVRSGSRKKLAS